MHLACWVAFAVGWLKGGHAERFAVAVLICDYVFTFAIEHAFAGAIGGFRGAHAIVGGSGFVITVLFLRVAFRSDRWWPLAGTGCLILNVMVHLLIFLTPVSLYAAVSAQVGLWILLYLILLAGVAERWMAGEAAVSRISPARGRRLLQTAGPDSDLPERPAFRPSFKP